MTDPDRLQRLRGEHARSIGFMQNFSFMGSAVALAAAASDCVDNDFASALGNLGITGVLLRAYASYPAMVAARLGGEAWRKAEAERLRRMLWAIPLGKVGCGLIIASLALQLLARSG